MIKILIKLYIYYFAVYNKTYIVNYNYIKNYNKNVKIYKNDKK